MEPASAVQPAVRARSLLKRYGPLLAVDGVDLDVAPGECVALLGPGGAGKTTTLRMLYGRTPATSGELEVLGLPVPGGLRSIKRRIGVLPQHDDLDDAFSVLRNLTLHGRCFGLGARECRRRAAELLGFLELEDRRGARVRDLPSGVRRRLMIARALVHAPALLLLDEPTGGLALDARLAVWDRIRALQRSGTTVLFATRHAREAERLASRVVVMDHGKILDSGPPDDLVARHAAGRVAELAGYPADVLAAVDDAGLRHEAAAERLLVHSSDERGELLLRALCARFPAARVTIRQGTLEDVFLKLAGRPLPDGSDAA